MPELRGMDREEEQGEEEAPTGERSGQPWRFSCEGQTTIRKELYAKGTREKQGRRECRAPHFPSPFTWRPCDF